MAAEFSIPASDKASRNALVTEYDEIFFLKKSIQRRKKRLLEIPNPQVCAEENPEIL